MTPKEMQQACLNAFELSKKFNMEAAYVILQIESGKTPKKFIRGELMLENIVNGVKTKVYRYDARKLMAWLENLKMKVLKSYIGIIEFRIQDQDCKIGIKRFYLGSKMQDEPEREIEVEFDVLDRDGWCADWLYETMSNREEERIIDKICEFMKEKSYEN